MKISEVEAVVEEVHAREPELHGSANGDDDYDVDEGGQGEFEILASTEKAPVEWRYLEGN